jgi:predicted permease
MISWLAEIRPALRQLGRSRGITAAAIATLALGTGATTAVVTLAYALLFRPLPAVEGTGLVAFEPTFERAASDDDGLSRPEIHALAESGTFAAVSSLVHRNLTLTGVDEPRRIDGASVETNFFDVLGVRPILGRAFRKDDEREFGHEETVVLSYGLWQDRFAGDPGAIGAQLEMNDRALTVVGILPPGFGLPEHTRAYVPFPADGWLDDRGRDWWTIARLPAGATAASLQPRVDAVLAQVAAAGPAADRGRGARVLGLRDSLVDEHGHRFLTLLVAAVIAVLLVACANVAALQMARGVAREGEMAVRRALGASRGRLAAIALVESALLALAGTALGFVLGRAGLVAALGAMDEELPTWLTVDLDPRLAAGIAAVASLAAIASGLLPALRLGDVPAAGALHAGARALGDRSGTRGQRALVAAQFAGSLALLTVAGWILGSFLALARADAGFDPRPVLSARFYLPGDRYDRPESRVVAERALLDRLSALPGVAAAATVTSLPADDGGAAEHVLAEGSSLAPEQAPAVSVVGVSPEFFAALGLALAAERTFTAAEFGAAQAPVAIVNRALAARLFPDGPALGRRLAYGQAADAPRLEVVGVAPDLVYEEIQEQTPRSRLQLYVPYARLGWRTGALVVRAAAGSPGALAPLVRRELSAVERDAPLFDVATYVDRLHQTYADRRVFGAIFAIFAVQALALAAIGLYGVVSYAASRRKREIGVRMALGATPADVRRQVVRLGVAPLGLGAAIGLALVALVAPLAGSVLYGVDPRRPGWAIAALGVLALAGLVASWLPAARAARLDPSSALRED